MQARFRGAAFVSLSQGVQLRGVCAKSAHPHLAERYAAASRVQNKLAAAVRFARRAIGMLALS